MLSVESDAATAPPIDTRPARERRVTMREHHPIHAFINRKKYEFDDPVQTGAALKRIASIPLGDVLFRQQPGEDEVIANDASITLKNGDHLHSQPAADYGLEVSALTDAGIDPGRTVQYEQDGGWTFLVLTDFCLPGGYLPDVVDLLIKVPPLFPQAAPDMFWVRPAVRAPNGGAPKGTSTERLRGEDWQRFSWHLAPGAWRPGVSTLRDYMRCVRARLLRLD